MRDLSKKLDALFDAAFRRGDTPDALMAIEAPGLDWRRANPPAGVGTRFCTASCTKLFTATLVLRAVEHGQMDLDAPVQRYLPTGTMTGLNRHGGTDHAEAITVRHLLSNTSGIPDFFEGRPKGRRSILDAIVAGHDDGWTLAEALDRTRSMPAPFAPGPGKALYSDTNFELLGAALELRTGLDFPALVRRDIVAPLGLEATAVFGDPNGPAYADIAPIRAGGARLQIPKTLKSLGPHGSVISTVADGLDFLDAFFAGHLFHRDWLDQMQHWNKLFFPLSYGMGLMRFSLPPAMTLFRALPELIGHSGASGVLMYANPARGIRIVGSSNQLRARERPYRFMAAALNLLR